MQEPHGELRELALVEDVSGEDNLRAGRVIGGEVEDAGRDGRNVVRAGVDPDRGHRVRVDVAGGNAGRAGLGGGDGGRV